MNLNHYLQDGAKIQARCVLMLLQDFNIEKSWNKEFKKYDAVIEVARWENCREQGYILYLRTKGKQLNIAFFEHRNTDDIHAVKWEQYSTNSLNIDTANFNSTGYKDNKWNTSFNVSYGEFLEMSDWIKEQFKTFYETLNKEEN